MKVSAIIPAYNNKNHLRMCLKSLESQKMKLSEIIVVDDGSHDGTWEMVRKEFPSVKLIRHSRNKGTCAALNTGIINARHEYIALLDQDLILPRTWIEKVVEEIKKEKKIAIVSGLHVPAGQKAIEYEAKSYYGCGFYGGGSLAKKSALLEAGLFPEEFFIYLHEADMAARLLNKGYRIKICPSIVSLNLPASTGLNRVKAYCCGQNTLWYVLRNYPLKYALFPLIFHLSRYFVRFTQGRCSIAFLKGILNAIRGVNSQIRKRKVCNELGSFLKRKISQFIISLKPLP